MSTAEVQVKVLSVADTTGFEKAKASLTNLQGELQKKLSAKGIGMSLLEGLGIGSGFRIADTITEQLVKPFKEAAEWAQTIERNTARALDRIKQLRDARNEGNVEAQRAALQADIAEAARALREAESKKSAGKITRYVDGTINTPNQRKETIFTEQTAEEKKAAEAATETWKDALHKLELFEVAQKRVNEARNKASGEETANTARKNADARGEDELKIANAIDARTQSMKRSSDAIRASITPNAEYKKKLEEINFLANTMDANGKAFLSANEAAAAIKKLNAEFARPELIRKSAEALEGYRDSLDKIDKNPLLTDKQKREARANVLALENQEIRRQIELWTELNAIAPNADNQARIDQLNRDKRVNESSNIAPLSKIQQGAKAGMEWEDADKHYQGGAEGFLGGAMEMLIEFGTLGDQIASSFKNVMGNAVQSISNGITGLIMRTQTWRQALSNIGLSILTSIVSAIVQMGVRWVATQIMMAAFGKAITAAAIATSIPLAMAATMVWAAPATLATIATFGGAAMQAPMSILSAQGLVMAGSLMQFAKGGLIPEGRRIIEVNEQGQESVLNASATNRLGSQFVDAVNAGDWARAQQYFNPVAAITKPAFSPELQEGGAGAIERQEQGLGTIAVRGFNAAHEIQQHLESRPGKKWIVDLIRQEARRV
jgi:hypothetical protein